MQKKKNSERDKILETDLYQPIYEYMVNNGYTVRSEVKNCDITAVKGDELIIIELKLSLNMTLLVQATNRQRAADSVYVAIPRPKEGIFSKNWRGMCHVLKRLELGLILVSPGKGRAGVEIAFHPEPLERKKNKKMRFTIITEIAGRNGDFNVGGSTKRKLMTAYRENSLQIACYIERFGPVEPKKLKEIGTGEKTGAILRQNFYGWFERIGEGLYRLSGKGTDALEEYSELAAYYRIEAEGKACL